MNCQYYVRNERRDKRDDEVRCSKDSADVTNRSNVTNYTERAPQLPWESRLQLDSQEGTLQPDQFFIDFGAPLCRCYALMPFNRARMRA